MGEGTGPPPHREGAVGRGGPRPRPAAGKPQSGGGVKRHQLDDALSAERPHTRVQVQHVLCMSTAVPAWAESLNVEQTLADV